MIHRNVGTLDRAVRVALGIILFPLGLFLLAAKSGYGLWVAIAGLIGLATGLIGFCGLYVPFGISTARQKAMAPGGQRHPASHP
jgi:hypothetical protein